MHYPFPKSETKGDTDFIAKFDDLLKSDKIIEKNFLGSSKCRLCDKNNGSKEFTLKYEGIDFIFPEGLRHYYEDHNVHPSKEFRNAVMNS